MSQDDPLPFDPSHAVRSHLIRLDCTNPQQWMVLPPVSAIASFSPFPWSRLPLSLHCWLTGLGSEFRRRHQRCLATLLILDCQQQRWAQSIIPSQSCGADGAAWTLEWGEQALPTGHFIAGSFQMRVAGSLMEGVETVPQIDGLHIVQTLQGQQSYAYCFVHSVGETAIVPVEQAMEDDWAATLNMATTWMTFE